MLEIYLILVGLIIPLGLAKRRRSRSRGFVAIPFSGSFVLSTLGSDAVVIGDLFGGNLTEDFYAISMDIDAEILNITAGEGNPSMLGIAHSDYTAAEIAENLNVTLLGPGTKIEQERSRRLVRKGATFHGNELNTHTSMKASGKFGPGPQRMKIKFVIQNGKTLDVFVYNKSGAVYTTGATCKFWGTIYGRWIL